MQIIWNPWHGCVRYSAGCLHCYVFRRDTEIGRDPGKPSPTSSFDLPVRRKASGEWTVPSGTGVFCCLSSDFFLDVADPWRRAAWEMIRTRDDLHFTIITKRVERIATCLPPDWGGGWRHVTICATVEDQHACDTRMPEFLSLPLRHRAVVAEPLLGMIDFSPYLSSALEWVSVGGESGPEARVCDYEWVTSIRDQCVRAGVAFRFKQTGASFRRGGVLYSIPRPAQFTQAKKAGIDWSPSA